MTKGTVKSEDRSAACLLRRATARQVEDLLRETESGRELRRWGFHLVVHGEEESLRVHAAAPARDDLPDLEAVLPGSRWWVSPDPNHAERLATRLARALRWQWDHWVTGASA